MGRSQEEIVAYPRASARALQIPTLPDGEGQVPDRQAVPCWGRQYEEVQHPVVRGKFWAT